MTVQVRELLTHITARTQGIDMNKLSRRVIAFVLAAVSAGLASGALVSSAGGVLAGSAGGVKASCGIAGGSG